MQFKVPQFIDMEDKIVGPLTLKQFAYILGAGGFSFLLWTFIPIKVVAVIFIIPVGGFFIALAFIKINDRPFIDVVESAVGYYTSSKIYTWRQPTAVQNNITENIVAETTKEIAVAKANSNKLHEISLGLDVMDKQENKE
ncbi:MAG: PrgI family protein [Candidatus Nomurabacteria bacterium]